MLLPRQLCVLRSARRGGPAARRALLGAAGSWRCAHGAPQPRAPAGAPPRAHATTAAGAAPGAAASAAAGARAGAGGAIGPAGLLGIYAELSKSRLSTLVVLTTGAWGREGPTSRA